MKYPICGPKQKDQMTYGRCPVCGANTQETGFVWLTAGGQLHRPNGDTCFKDFSPLHNEVWFDVGFHGAHGAQAEGMSRKDRYVYAWLPIVKQYWCDHFEFQFCSTQCARKWFNELMDDLDAEIQKQIDETEYSEEENDSEQAV